MAAVPAPQIVEYAPPAHRGENVTVIPVKDVEAITAEITEVIRAAKDEIAELEQNALIVRKLYVEHTLRISAHIKRLRAGVKLSMDTMEALRNQCRALDAPTEVPLTDIEKDYQRPLSDKERNALLEDGIAEIANKFKPNEAKPSGDTG